MKIADGTRIGIYEITGTLGSGAMGNVYRARDHRLERDVAIKALPESLCADPDALARFEREARFLAALNHPSIGSIYGIEEVTDERLLVLELVPGETLEERLHRGPIPLAETLRIAVQIAGALEAAHEAEIVHRDLKPSNVKVTPEGRVKLLDFGIARQAASSGTGHDDELSITRSGAIVGTPQYMSPEQLYGEAVDRRADVWAFGCLLYEMLSGRHAFPGKSFFELSDAIRNREPDWSALPRGTPDSLRRLLMRCLRKEPHDRLHDIADARIELEDLIARRGSTARRISRTAALGTAGVLVPAVAIVATLLALRVTRSRATVDATPLRLSQLTSTEGVEQFPAWSPEGASIAYSGEVGGIRKLFVKRLGGADAQQLTSGRQDDTQPAWSTDGSHVLFVRARDAGRRLEPGDVFGSYESDAGDVWSVDVKTRAEARVLPNAFYPDVSPDGRSIAVDASWAGPRRIWIVDARGLNPQQITSDSSEAVVHVQPRWSPDGKRIVYQRIERTRFDVAVVDLGTKLSSMVTRDVYRKINPAWARDGRAIYYSSDAGGGMNVWRQPLDAQSRPAGPAQQMTSGAGQDVEIAVAPDGKRLAYTTLHQNADLWRMPMTPEGAVAGTPEQLVATTREDSRGEWSPDGRQIAFNSDRAGTMNLWLHSLSDHTTRQITSGAGGDFQPTWSPDGKTLVFFSSRGGKADTDIWSVDAASGKLTPLTQGRSLDLNPFFSPDGKEIVFQSDSSGRLELWVMAADGSRRRQLTTIGATGHFIRWLRDGYIYFRSPSNVKLLRVSSSGGEPQVTVADAGSHISFSPDGTRIIDVRGHKALWLIPMQGDARKLFEFEDADVRIDYPVWSPDGKWLLFDWFKPKEGDLWLAEEIAR
jgi:Tol biopolymer transport system component